ncbi:MAG: hypothetical protein ACFFKA_02555 [Candidatus Thorarchaeota archaeon]
MDCGIKSSNGIKSISISNLSENFNRELAYGQFNALIYEKQRDLNQYLTAYNNLSDKRSFKADYLDSLIYIVKKEITELQKLF